MKNVNKLSLAMLLISSGFAHAELSQFSGNLGASTASFNSSTGKILEGGINFDLQNNLGVQLDGLYSEVGEVDFTGVGGHFYFSDNETSSIGLGAGAVFGDNLDSYEAAIEGEYYLGAFTLGAKAGFASIEYDNSFELLDADTEDAFGQIYVNFYPVEELLISASIENRFDHTFYSLTAEYDLPVDGLSLFASATKGEDGYDQALVGARYYFGGYENLQQRHRSNGFKSILGGLLNGIGNYGAEFNRRATDAGFSSSGTFGAEQWSSYSSEIVIPTAPVAIGDL